MKVVIDTREQLPYEFEDSITRTLQTGDYSIFGYEDQITVERKTKADAYGTIGKAKGSHGLQDTQKPLCNLREPRKS